MTLARDRQNPTRWANKWMLATEEEAAAGVRDDVVMSPYLTALATNPGSLLDIREFGENVGAGGDDSAAIKAAVEYVNDLATANALTPPIYFPAGVYNIGANTIPPFRNCGGAVIGDGAERTWIKVLPSYVGDVFSWSESFWQSDFPHSGPTTPNLNVIDIGPRVVGISIMGDLTAPTVQNGLMLYDRNSKAYFDDVMLFYLTGYALCMGKNNFTPNRGYTVESDFKNIYVWGCGKTVPSVEITTEGTVGLTDIVTFYNLNIYAPQGGGALKMRAIAPVSIGTIRFFGLRCEGVSAPPVPIPGDLLTIGDPAMGGRISNVYIEDFVGVKAPAGYATIRVTHNGITNAPYNIQFVGGKIGPADGRGIVVDYGRALRFGIRDMSTTEPNVTIAENAGADITIDANGAEAGWSYDLTAAAQSSLRYYLRAAPYDNVGLTLNLPDDPASLNGGDARGAGAVDLQTLRGTAAQVASGANSAILAGTTNTASGITSAVVAGTANTVSGVSSVAIGGTTNSLTGVRSVSLGGFRGNDRGRQGCVVHSSNTIFGGLGDAQGCNFVLQGTTSTATAVRLTTQGTTADATNVVNIPSAMAFSLVVTLTAVNRTDRTNWYSWHLPQAVLYRGASTAITLGTPTILSNAGTGSVAGIAVSLTADTTLGGINLSFTPPTSNNVAWDVCARVYTTEVV